MGTQKDFSKEVKSLERLDTVRRLWRWMLPADRTAFLKATINKALPVELEEIEQILNAEKRRREIDGWGKDVLERDVPNESRVNQLNRLYEKE